MPSQTTSCLETLLLVPTSKCILIASLLNKIITDLIPDLEDLECEGLQSILIDWQGGFVGSVANDLMWSLFPFLEANQEKKVGRKV